MTLDHQVLDPGQSRPRLRTDLVVVPHDSTSFVIEDPLSGRFFLVGAKEWSFISQLDGAETISAAVGRSATQMGSQVLSEPEAISVARWLVDQGLARPAEAIGDGKAKAKGPKPGGAPAFNPLAIRWPLTSPDRALARIAPYSNWFWSKWGFGVWFVCLVLAAAKVSAHAGEWQSMPLNVFDSHNWLRMLVVWCALKFIHELGHGLACKRFGVPVRRAGILFLFLAPLPYIDVSAAWRLPSAWQRIAISAAGMYVETLLAFVAVLLWTPGSVGTFDRVCVDVALLASVHTIVFNANPLMRFDGYYILIDALGLPNLYNEGQQRLAMAAKHWLGGADVTPPAATAFSGRATLLYGVLSLGWRCLSFLGMAISLIAGWGWWSLPAIVFLWGFWFGFPMVGKKKPPVEGVRTFAARRRQVVSWSAMVAAAALFVVWLVSPAYVTAPAVVEFANLTVLRAKCAGFVTAVHVADGQNVAAGQLLIELTNEDLVSEIKAVEIGIKQSRVRSRWHFLQGELSKQQAELANAKSLEQKRDELRSQLECLQVRAPCAATVVSRGLPAMLGSYLEQGASLVVLAAESEKEVLVSVAATDADDFLSQLDQPVSVYRDYVGAPCAGGRLAHVEPRISQRLPHVALGANLGGAVAVKPEAEPGAETGTGGVSALSPRLVAKVALDSDASSRLSAGQRVTVGLSGASQSWGGRILGLWRDYLGVISEQSQANERAAQRS